MTNLELYGTYLQLPEDLVFTAETMDCTNYNCATCSFRDFCNTLDEATNKRLKSNWNSHDFYHTFELLTAEYAHLSKSEFKHLYPELFI